MTDVGSWHWHSQCHLHDDTAQRSASVSVTLHKFSLHQLHQKNYLHLGFQFHPIKLVFRMKIFAEMTCLLASTVYGSTAVFVPNTTLHAIMSVSLSVSQVIASKSRTTSCL